MSLSTAPAEPRRVVGRYALYGEIAAGGMATVHLGRLIGEGGFSRTVAIKRLHPQFSKDPDFVEMFLDEARIAARIRHPNVVPTLDVVSDGDELLLVMDYVHGDSLSRIVRAATEVGQLIPANIVSAVLSQALQGLHAAHEATTERGQRLNIVHRDISPQNIMVGVDGVAQVLDFGVAKAAIQATSTREGQIKGKINYMAPEQFGSGDIDRRADIWAAGTVLWEALTGKRLFAGRDPAHIMGLIARAEFEPPSQLRGDVSAAVDGVVARALQDEPDHRYADALEFSSALEAAIAPATPREVGAWVKGILGSGLAEREQRVAEVESVSAVQLRPSMAGSERLSNPRSAAVATAPSSVAYPPSRPASGGAMRPLALVAAALGGAVLVLLVILLVLPRGADPEGGGEAAATTAAAQEVLSAEPVAPAEAVPAPTPAPAPAPTVAVDSLPAEPAAEEDAGVQPNPPKATPQPKPAAKPKTKPANKPRAAPKPKPKAPPGCNPPYTIDANGIKRVKSHCL